MQFNELKDGNFYVTKDKHPGYLFQKLGDCSKINYLYITNPMYSTGNINANLNPSFDTYREATFDEIQWFLACKEVGHTVPKPENIQPSIQENYDIWE